MKKYIVAVLGGILLAGSVSAATFHPLCEPSGGGTPAPCADTTVVTSGLPTVWTVPVLYATDVQTAHIGSPNGDFTQLQVGAGGLSVYGSADVSDDLDVSGNATIDGGLDVGGWVTGDAAQFNSLSLWFGGVLSFWDNAYASISALVTGLKFVGNQILTMNWEGKGACHVDKSLDGSKTYWWWIDNSGVPQATTSLAGVPTQCLDTNGQ